ncbi:hypothetical protein BZA70DRAFT_272700 [Myxozyma melibiosi]|uniref:tRNA (uracil-O(2)-)-methyltransferase n=1 Tax=Myxozyma melibiosi TaxID=54550 RepID=A0ABR1FDU1_9ASCO
MTSAPDASKPSPVSLTEAISSSDDLWRSVLCQHDCEFDLDHFEAAMLNLIFQPNINSSSIMRTDVVYDSESHGTNGAEAGAADEFVAQERRVTLGLVESGLLSSDLPDRRILRTLVPRNPNKDLPMKQTCHIYSSDHTRSVVYIPHLDSRDATPYYHPAVSGILLQYKKPANDANALGELRLYYRLFPEDQHTGLSNRLERTALRLITTAARHSKGTMSGYEKRVHHDVVVDKVAFQNRYLELKDKHARFLIDNWVESTDPKKHVFEDLSIAAFLIELWQTRFGHSPDSKKLIFADLGCGNGVLVYILIMEGYEGYGIEARRRKTWSIFPQRVQDCLREQVLLPYLCFDSEEAEHQWSSETGLRFHNGKFDSATFIIGNHSDELTPWIPLLDCPFIVIPCCSHAFSGAKHRYPTTVSAATALDKATGQQKLSTYGALVEHVARLADQLGWSVEREMLRIPSTRNASIIGLGKREEGGVLSPREVLMQNGGAAGFIENVTALMSRNPRSH